MTKFIETAEAAAFIATADHIWSAIRGLCLLQRSDDDLDRIRAMHLLKDAYASRVIVLAVDQTRAIRFALQQGDAA